MIKDLALYEKSLSIGSLGAYIHWTNQLPMLTADEEHELTHQLKENNDLESARKLILSHLRLVVKIARGYQGYGLQQADLIQEGNIGLMKAVKRFNPAVGVRLVSYALHWIRAEIHEFVIKNWKIVKIATTKAQRKLFFNLRRMAKSNTLSESEIKIIAEELKVSQKDVRIMEQRLNNYDQSFDTAVFVSNDSNDDWGSPASYLEDHSLDPAQLVEAQSQIKKQHNDLYNGLSTLDARAQDIIKKRWLNEKKTTLTALANEYSVSAERIRQLEQIALRKLRSLL